MRTFWLFRSNLKPLEDYHKIKNLEEFEKGCWDFYLLMGVQFLKLDCFDEVIIWRLSDEIIDDIIFEIGNKKFIQRWVKNFNEIFRYPKPDISFFRGGFPEYCEVIKKNLKFFGLKLYLSAGKRILPQYGGVYDRILVEDNRKLNIKNSIPFFKTVNPNIFYPKKDVEKIYDVCFIANFVQFKYKGQEFIFNEIAKNKSLQKLKFLHIGNDLQRGLMMVAKYELKNIFFAGLMDRNSINDFLNESKIGLVASNKEDGCPRICTEIMCSGTPLLVRNETNLLDYYRKVGESFPDDNFASCLFKMLEDNQTYRDRLKEWDGLSMDKICEMNYKLW